MAKITVDIKLYKCKKAFYGYKEGFLYPFTEFENQKCYASPCIPTKYVHEEEFLPHFEEVKFPDSFLNYMQDMYRDVSRSWNLLIDIMPWYYKYPNKDLFEGNFHDFLVIVGEYQMKHTENIVFTK